MDKKWIKIDKKWIKLFSPHFNQNTYEIQNIIFMKLISRKIVQKIALYITNYAVRSVNFCLLCIWRFY
jgi:ribosomal protein S17E